MTETRKMNDVSNLELYPYYELQFSCGWECNCNETGLIMYISEENWEDNIGGINLEFDNYSDLEDFMNTKIDVESL